MLETYHDFYQRITNEGQRQRLSDWNNKHKFAYWTTERFKTTEDVLNFLLQITHSDFINSESKNTQY